MNIYGIVIWLMFCLAPLRSILLSITNTEDGAVRKGKCFYFRSNIQRLLLGFPSWIEKIDRSYVFINIFNELCLLVFVVGWFVLDVSKKNFLLKNFAMVMAVELAMGIAQIIWGMVLITHSEKPTVYTRETFDLKERKGQVVVNECAYDYVLTSHKKEETNKLVFFLPQSYDVMQDVEGNVYIWHKKRLLVKNTNVAPYEELADSLVRAGYVTLRCGATPEDLKLKNDTVDVYQLFTTIMSEIKFEGDIYLFAHGFANERLQEIFAKVNAKGIVSMCNIKTDFTQLNDVPVLAGFVEEDPHNDQESVNEKINFMPENVTVIKFDKTDFTFRKMEINKKVNCTKTGRDINPGFSLPAMNSEIAEKVIEWLDAH